MTRAINEGGIRALIVPRKCVEARNVPFLSQEASERAHRFHSTLPGYNSTHLRSLKVLAGRLGVGEIFVKDESTRFGLNAFKVLGGSFAVARAICGKAGLDIARVTYSDLVSGLVKQKTGHITFATATAGNHGRGVAWAARVLGHGAVIYVPKGTSQNRVASIKELGAQVVMSRLGYDEAVGLCVRDAQTNGWQVVQDTAWEGYTAIPQWIMQGYTTIMEELEGQMETPTHVFLQAGVGGLAAAVLGYYRNLRPTDYPSAIIVEPNCYACLLASATERSGMPHTLMEGVGGELKTIMAGLACREPNPLAWEILRDSASAYLACPDSVAIRGMRILANPLDRDPRVVSGESGAVGIGLLSILMGSPRYNDLKAALGINRDSRILFINTEGDTDPETYQDIIQG